MPDSNPQTGPRHEPERVHERAADAAETANRPLEPKSSDGQLAERDEPGEGPDGPRPEPAHHALNTPVGDPDPTADSDPYEPDGDEDRASGARGANQGAENR